MREILIRTPEYFHWLVAQVERSAPDRQDHEEELVSAFAAIDDPVEGLNMLRRWKRRETLRIGTRDLLRHETVQTVAAQLSDVASVAVDFALAIVMQQRLDGEREVDRHGRDVRQLCRRSLNRFVAEQIARADAQRLAALPAPKHVEPFDGIVDGRKRRHELFLVILPIGRAALDLRDQPVKVLGRPDEDVAQAAARRP